VKRNFVIALAASALLCGGCTSRAHASDDDAEDNPHYSDGTERGNETYPEFDDRRDDLNGSRGSFADEGCTVDCSGHEAGYAWAEERGINDPDDCGGKSWSFEEGCRAYAEGRSADTDDESDDASEDEEATQ
jgi:hypothetical protein